jgi:hypothetical protein
MKTIVMLTMAICLPSLQLPAQAQQQELQQKLAMIKEGVAQNQAALRHYTWTEQTNVLLKGEVKKTVYYQCEYGPDGTVQKMQTGSSPAAAKQRGRLREHVVEKKTDELKEYMQQAGALVKQYVPPNPEQMKASFQSGNASLAEAGPGAVQLDFKNYVKPGDSLALRFGTATKSLSQIKVKTYMSGPSDAVTLQVNFQTLPGGPNYVAQTVLDAPAKNIQVQTTSSNFQRIGQ